MSFRTCLSHSIKLILVAAALAAECSCAHSESPLRVGLGQTVTRDVIATKGRGVFRFEGEGTLMVNREGSEYSVLDEKTDKLILVPPGTNESEGIPMSQDGGLGYWVGPLSKTGVYQLILRRSS
jgi:hypothetical protein